MDEIYEEGDTVTFTCIAQGGPGNSLQWQKDGEDFGGAIDGNENTLTLTDITVFNDSGVYTCVASNAAGTGSASVSLNISPVFDLHPTSIIRVSWEEVPAIDRNGEITVYEVQYEPLETFCGQISTSTVNTSMLSINLNGLQEYVDYNISVRAYTSAGPGPYSDPVTEMTDTASKLC